MYAKSGFKPGSYWAMTSGNSIMDTLLQDADERTYKDLSALESGGSITSDIDTSVICKDLGRNRNSMYSLMAVTGYLNAVPDRDGMYLLTVPNYEVREIFASKITSHLGFSRDGSPFLLHAADGDVEGMKDDLRVCMDEAVSVRNDWSPYTFQAIITMLLYRRNSGFTVSSDRESGDGFYDVRVMNPDPDGPHIVVEVKSTKDGSVDLDDLAGKALRQIHDRRYCAEVKGRIMLYGIAFHGKRFSIASDSISG